MLSEHVSSPIWRKVVGGGMLALSFGYLSYTILRNWSEIENYHWRVNYLGIGLAFGCYSVALALAALGWGQLMKDLTGMTGRSKHFKYYVYTALLRRLPAPLIYLFGRAHFYEREGVPKSTTVAATLIEWVLLVTAGVIVYILMLPFSHLPLLRYNLWVLLAGGVMGVLLIQARSGEFIVRLPGLRWESQGKGTLTYTRLAFWLLIYGGVWLGGGGMLYALVDMVYPLSLSHLPAVVEVWVLSGLAAMLFFVLSVGLGVRELTLGLLLGYLVPQPIAALCAVLVRVILTLFEIAWGLIALGL